MRFYVKDIFRHKAEEILGSGDPAPPEWLASFELGAAAMAEAVRDVIRLSSGGGRTLARQILDLEQECDDFTQAMVHRIEDMPRHDEEHLPPVDHSEE
jgi:hypothetical protein